MPSPATVTLMRAAHDGRPTDAAPVRTRTDHNGTVPTAPEEGPRTVGVSAAAGAIALARANERVRRSSTRNRELQELLDEAIDERDELRKMLRTFARMVYADQKGRRPHATSEDQRRALKLAMALAVEGMNTHGNRLAKRPTVTVEDLEADTAARNAGRVSTLDEDDVIDLTTPARTASKES